MELSCGLFDDRRGCVLHFQKVVKQWFWLLLALVTIKCPTCLAGQAPVRVTAERLGLNRVRMMGEVASPTPRQIVWDLLKDYEHLSEWIPGLVESRVVQTKPTMLLFQRGTTRLGFFKQNVQVTFEVEESGNEIRFKAISGDFLEHEGMWLLKSDGDMTIVHYEATIRPKVFLPPFIGTWLLKSQLSHSLSAVVERAEELRNSRATVL